MTSITPINNIPANYNAVKIQVNDPKTVIPEGFKGSIDDYSNYNATNIEINRPTVEVKKDSIYSYPDADEIVTFEKTQILPIYVANIDPTKEASENIEDAEIIEEISVPEPNITDLNSEKKNIVQA